MIFHYQKHTVLNYLCKAAEIRQSVTDQLVIASPQEKTRPKTHSYIKYKVY